LLGCHGQDLWLDKEGGSHVIQIKRALRLTNNPTVAKAALRRKKAFEHQLEQTSAQMMTVEREIGSIESANINKETLDAMKNASKAIQNIHGGLTVDQVDQTMEDLREQHAVGEEIAEALTQGAQTSGVDEDELDEELAELQQEQLDERMLKTGSVPVHDQIQRMPNAPSKFLGAEDGRKEWEANLVTAKNTPTAEEDDEEAELRKLQAEMAM
jgi:charged multivesicular body protein 4